LIEGLRPFWPDGLVERVQEQIPEKARDVLNGK
jgi:hypothetical protein